MPAPSTPPPLGGDEATLYERHRRDLLNVVRRRVNISEDLIEDACQHAWSMLLSTQPDRGPALFGWLLTVAVREGYMLSAREGRTESLDSPAHRDHRSRTTAADRLPACTTIDDTLEARRALRALASLKPRQQRYAALQVAGHSYAEIAAAEHATYTNVNKHLARAHDELRQAVVLAA